MFRLFLLVSLTAATTAQVTTLAPTAATAQVPTMIPSGLFAEPTLEPTSGSCIRSGDCVPTSSSKHYCCTGKCRFVGDLSSPCGYRCLDDNVDDTLASDDTAVCLPKPTHEPTFSHAPTPSPDPTRSPAPTLENCKRGGECLQKGRTCCSGKCHTTGACSTGVRCNNDADDDNGNIIYNMTQCRAALHEPNDASGIFTIIEAIAAILVMICLCVVAGSVWGLGSTWACICRTGRVEKQPEPPAAASPWRGLAAEDAYAPLAAEPVFVATAEPLEATVVAEEGAVKYDVVDGAGPPRGQLAPAAGNN